MIESIELRAAGLVLELDRDEVCIEDPGQGTPAIVMDPQSGASSTFYHAFDMGLLESGSGPDYILGQDQIDFLEAVAPFVEDFLYGEVSDEDLELICEITGGIVETS